MTIYYANSHMPAVKNEKKIDYKMPMSMFEGLLKTRNKEEKRMNPYEYVAKVINNEFGLRGKVINVITY